MPQHTVIVGCPGTGKTTDLARRVGEYRRSGGGRVVFCSHTRAAAKAAVDKGIGKVDTMIKVGTIHSLCFGYLDLSKAQVAEGQKLWEFCKSVGAPVGKSEYEDVGNDLGDAYLELMSVARARMATPGEAYERSNRPGTLAHFESFVKSYNVWKSAYGYIDFSDMLERATELKSFGDIKLLVVDEAQDLTPLHWRVIERVMAVTGCRVIVAGDTDQAINTWAGADPMAMHAFEDKYKAQREVLPQSHRIPRRIHSLAEAVIDRAKVRVQRQYAPRPDAVGDYRRCMDMVEMSHEINPDNDTLVVYADRFQRKQVETELREAAIGYSAISGGPAPLDMRGGRALLEVHKQSPDESTVSRGLSEVGRIVWDSIGPHAVYEKVRKGDYSPLALATYHLDYYHRVPKHRPPKVRISTIHGAKGLEADDVHLVTGQSQAAIDHSFVDPDSSHRTFYVGVTRTRNRLVAYDSDGNYELPQ